MDCKLHVTVTPYNPRIVPSEIKAVESFTASSLKRCQWPPNNLNGRAAEGGCGGQVVAEQIVVTEKRSNGREIVYHASFLAQLDGQVAYVPRYETENDSKNPHRGAFLILIENPVAEIHAIRFLGSQSVIIDPYVKHSMPIPIDGTFEFNVWHRAVNAVAQLNADPAGIKPIVINLCKVDRVKQVEVSHIKQATRKVVTLPHSFAKELLPLEEADPNSLSIYGQYIPNPKEHQEQVYFYNLHNIFKVTEVPWPGADCSDGVGGTLEQEFLVGWQPKQQSSHDTFILEFEGLSGSFAGEKGRPGVEYSAELGIYKANLLMARPDGSFYTFPTNSDETFAMAIALPNSSDGNPLEKTLRVFPCVWHSVPIPVTNFETPLVFREIVAATNANLVVDLPKEVGHSLQFAQSV